jgi:hypothetical protein
MAKGLPKSIIKKYGITKKAWSVYRGKKKAQSPSRVTKKPKKRRKSYVTRRKRRRGSRKMTIPIAPIAGLIAGLAEPAVIAMTGDFATAADKLVGKYTGYSMAQKTWRLEWAMEGLTPLILGALVHKFVGGPPLNINGMLARAKVPLIRI